LGEVVKAAPVLFTSTVVCEVESRPLVGRDFEQKVEKFVFPLMLQKQ
jgi:hypothetical protein